MYFQYLPNEHVTQIAANVTFIHRDRNPKVNENKQNPFPNAVTELLKTLAHSNSSIYTHTHKHKHELFTLLLCEPQTFFHGKEFKTAKRIDGSDTSTLNEEKHKIPRPPRAYHVPMDDAPPSRTMRNNTVKLVVDLLFITSYNLIINCI